MSDEENIAPHLSLVEAEPVRIPDGTLIGLAGDKPMTTSLKVAETFDKKHKDVLRAIRNLECSGGFRRLNFAPTQIDVKMPTGGTRKDNAFNLTRDGFTFLVMGFTGPKAAQFKEKYIAAFSEMELHLQKQAVLAEILPKNVPEALRFAAKMAEGRLLAEEKLAEARPKVKQLERIEATDGSICITDAAKILKIRPKELFSYMSSNGWIYKRVTGPWIGYQSKLQSGYLEHCESSTTNCEGFEKIRVQVRVTGKGLSKLAGLLNQPLLLDEEDGSDGMCGV